jgi:hypothetical protein
MQRVAGYREKPAPAGLAGMVACLWRDEASAARCTSPVRILAHSLRRCPPGG